MAHQQSHAVRALAGAVNLKCDECTAIYERVRDHALNYVMVLDNYVNADATLSGKQATQLGSEIVWRTDKVMRNQGALFDYNDTLTMAAYINTCKA